MVTLVVCMCSVCAGVSRSFLDEKSHIDTCIHLESHLHGLDHTVNGGLSLSAHAYMCSDHSAQEECPLAGLIGLGTRPLACTAGSSARLRYIRWGSVLEVFSQAMVATLGVRSHRVKVYTTLGVGRHPVHVKHDKSASHLARQLAPRWVVSFVHFAPQRGTAAVMKTGSDCRESGTKGGSRPSG